MVLIWIWATYPGVWFHDDDKLCTRNLIKIPCKEPTEHFKLDPMPIKCKWIKPAIVFELTVFIHLLDGAFVFISFHMIVDTHLSTIDAYKNFV